MRPSTNPDSGSTPTGDCSSTAATRDDSTARANGSPANGGACRSNCDDCCSGCGNRDNSARRVHETSEYAYCRGGWSRIVC